MEIKWIGSPNFGYPRGTHGQNKPEALFWHITASAPTRIHLDGLDGWFQNLAAGSTQWGIQDKACHQYIKIEDAAWGQGYMDNPDLSNPNVRRWWDAGINPNLRSVGCEVVALPGSIEVRRGIHLVNDDTWGTMRELGRYVAEEIPRIGFVAVNWLGHWQVDGVNRQRDPKNVYWPTDILEEIFSKVVSVSELEGDNMFIVSVPGQGTTWRTNGMGKIHNKTREEREYWANLYGVSPVAIDISKKDLDRLVDVSS